MPAAYRSQVIERAGGGGVAIRLSPARRLTKKEATEAWRVARGRGLSIVKDITPVKTGRLRAGWRVSRDVNTFTYNNRVSYAAPVFFGKGKHRGKLSTAARRIRSAINTAVKKES